MSLNEILRKHEFRYKKRLGQNFITDPGLLTKIVNTAETSNEDIVVEIGPGAGTLTKFLAQKASKVIAIEVDDQLIPILRETLADYENISVICNDALKINLDQLVQEIAHTTKSYKVVANLPYYITTPLIMHFLESSFNIERIVVMVQKEVAERINALPGTKEYGALTVSVNLYCEPQVAFIVPRHLFTPQPLVDSAVLDLQLRNTPPFEIKNRDALQRLVKAAFNQRRKTLTNALKVLGMEKEKIVSILEECGINPKRRGETLTLEEFVKVANRLS